MPSKSCRNSGEVSRGARGDAGEGRGCVSGAIKRKVELDWGTEDQEYLQKVELHSEGALNETRPDIIIYNAGTDILDGDPLGGLAISPQVRLSVTQHRLCPFLLLWEKSL